MVSLYFNDQAATRFPILVELQGDQALPIPAGVADFVVQDRLVLPAGAQLLATFLTPTTSVPALRQ